jgi:hypothetical protein
VHNERRFHGNREWQTGRGLSRKLETRVATVPEKAAERADGRRNAN